MLHRLYLPLRPVLLLIALLSVGIQSVTASPNTLVKSATLYTNGHPVTSEYGNIPSMAATDNGILFVSFAGLTNGQGQSTTELHVWNVSNPASPVLLSRIDFSDPGERRNPDDPSFLAPHDMVVTKGHLVFWRNFELYSYEIGADGSLTQVFHSDFADNLNTDLNRPEIGGLYGATERQLLTNNEFLRLIDEVGYDRAEDLLAEYTLINFQNPAEPFLVYENQFAGKNLRMFDPPPTGELNGLPARLSLSEDELNLNLLSYRQVRDTHISSFWEPVFRNVFDRRRLNKTLGELTTLIVNRLNPTVLARSLNSIINATLQLPSNITFSAKMEAYLNQEALLSSVLETYGIDLNDSMELAVEKVVRTLIDADLNAALARRITKSTLDLWADVVFGDVPRSVRSISSGLEDALSTRLLRMRIDRYLVDVVMGPLIDLPPAFRVRLGALLDQITDTAAGQAIDTGLSTFHTAIPARRLLRRAGFEFPRCFDIPESSRQFLRLLLVKGAHLDLDNYAFVELIKLISHYNGSRKYERLMATVQRQVNALHEALSQDFALTIFKGLDGATVIGDRISSILTRIRGTIDSGPLTIKAIAASIVDALEVDGITGEMSVRAALESRGLYTEVSRLPGGGSLATNANFTVALNGMSIGEINLSALFKISTSAGVSASQAGVTTLSTELERMVNELWRRIFGELPPETTFSDAIARLITQRLRPQTIAETTQNLIGGALTNLNESVELPGIVGVGRLAFQGDCLAQLQLALLAISEAPVVGEFAVAAEIALAEVQDTTINFVVSTLLNEFLAQIFDQVAEDYPSWNLKLEAVTSAIPVAQLTNQDVRFYDPFHAGNRIGLVTRDLSVGGWSPGYTRSVNIALADPSDIAGTLSTISLGDWDSINGVVFNEQGFLLVGGEKLPDNQIPESTVSLTHFLEEGTPTYEMQGEDANDLKLSDELDVLNSGGAFASKIVGGRIVLFARTGG